MIAEFRSYPWKNPGGDAEWQRSDFAKREIRGIQSSGSTHVIIPRYRLRPAQDGHKLPPENWGHPFILSFLIALGHTWDHSSESQCEFASSQTGGLRIHLKTLLGEKNPKCNQCVLCNLKSFENSQVEPSGAKLNQVEPSGAKWSQVVPSGAKWSQVEPSGARWSQIDSNGAKWILAVRAD